MSVDHGKAPIAKTWRVDVLVFENDNRTSAEARLVPGSQVTAVGHGEAYRNPAEVDVPEIGDEIAVARSLIDLGQTLLRLGRADVDAMEGPSR